MTEVPYSVYAVRMIPVMNDEFGRLIADYQPVRADNRGSHRAGHELEAAHVDLDWCEQRLRELCRAFNPSKHGGGEPPRTLAYFVRGLIRDWRQYHLNLLAVERAPVVERPVAPVEVRPRAAASGPAPIAAAIGDWRTAFEEPGERKRA